MEAATQIKAEVHYNLNEKNTASSAALLYEAFSCLYCTCKQQGANVSLTHAGKMLHLGADNKHKQKSHKYWHKRAATNSSTASLTILVRVWVVLAQTASKAGARSGEVLQTVEPGSLLQGISCCGGQTGDPVSCVDKKERENMECYAGLPDNLYDSQHLETSL
eukprot:1141997-Pelagomonas_calceolata.AAC.11